MQTLLWVGLMACQGGAEEPATGSVCPGCTTHTISSEPTGTTGTTPTSTTPTTTPTGTTGPARERLMLHGGGSEDDAIYGRFAANAGFGHLVTMGATDPSNPDLLFWDDYWVGLGAASAETINTTSAADADDPAIIAAIDAADGIYVRGGDQSLYLQHWAGNAIEAALERAWDRGAVFGGSSAGCAILGERIYDAMEGSIDPYQALLDPFDPELTFTDGFLPALPGVITDTHFTERGRLGRLPVFLARWVEDGATAPIGLGVDPETALFVSEDGTAEVMGPGSVTLMQAPVAQTLRRNDPPDLRGVRVWQLIDGYRVDLYAPDPVLARPASVALVQAPVPVAWTDLTLDGNAGGDRARGQWVIPELNDDPFGWYYGDFSLVETASPDLTGTFVMTRLYDDLDYAENHVGGTMWALAQHPGAVGIAVDVWMSVDLAADGTASVPNHAYALVLDGRSVTAAGVPAVPGEPNTAALEGLTLDVVGGGQVWP